MYLLGINRELIPSRKLCYVYFCLFKASLFIFIIIFLGRMVLFTSPLKSADLDKQVYDPLTGDVKSYTVSKMESFKR